VSGKPTMVALLLASSATIAVAACTFASCSNPSSNSVPVDATAESNCPSPFHLAPSAACTQEGQTCPGYDVDGACFFLTLECTDGSFVRIGADGCASPPGMCDAGNLVYPGCECAADASFYCLPCNYWVGCGTDGTWGLCECASDSGGP
jgi:hypothetical protein